MTTQYPAAVLWDMDGTIVDTEPAWIAAETKLASEFGGQWTLEDGEQMIGFGMALSAQLLQAKGVTLSEEEIIKRLTDDVIAMVSVKMPWRPGALELMTELHSAGVRQALVTMSVSPLAQRVAQAIPFDAFEVLVTGDSVANSKPHPEPYLRAAELLGVDPAHCVAIEDSPPGLASALAAGAIGIGVPHHAEMVEASNYLIWPTLDGRGAGDIAAAYASRATDRDRDVADSVDAVDSVDSVTGP